MAGGIEPGFSSGWFGTGDAMLGEQQSQIQQALEIARLHMDEARTAHQQKLDDWMQSAENPLNVHAAAQAKYWEDQAATNKQYREDWADTQKQAKATAAQKEKDAATQKLVDEMDKGMGVGMDPFVAGAALSKNNPEVFQAKIKGLIGQKQSEVNAMPPQTPPPYTVPMLPGASTPSSIEASPGPPFQSQQAAMPAQGQVQGAPMPSRTASLEVPFGESQITPPPLPVQQVTEADLHGYTSPQFRELQRKNAAAQAVANMNADTKSLLAQTDADYKADRSATYDRSIDVKNKVADTQREALKQRLGPYANGADILKRKYDIADEAIASLDAHRKAMEAVAKSNAANRASTIANNTGPAMKAYNEMQQHVEHVTTEKEKLEAAFATTDKQVSVIREAAVNSGAMAAVSDDPKLASKAREDAALLHSLTDRRNQLKHELDDIKDPKTGTLAVLSALRDQMREQMESKGIITATDGKKSPGATIPAAPARTGSLPALPPMGIQGGRPKLEDIAKRHGF